ncbi:redoxin domain-containing protein [Fimbriimonas ginsengisoli Gsoil 348]|uniref:Redoxin domain-containing protein n=2 Tax=Fimbriimonas ginsengisoli TaxID=1005039 RepID=A0A068NS66_FIMGI|nr:redoxin domain-containing protein [Fimbriimonas ginsengisoli Gsoil 348]
MEGIGDTPFPVTAKNAEVQLWFNQGEALLHSFWFEEAERSFRWCLKLDPDCAMAYWGLARTGLTWFVSGDVASPQYQRYRDFLKEAMKRKDSVSERERLYIEAWNEAYAPGEKERFKILSRRLQEIVLKFPDDLEAKALLGLYNIGQGSAYANELIIQQVLAKNPMHPGAHHARIHNWDDVDAVQALQSCRLYGASAPGIGHALHMPGHAYSKIGMWHEAARAMDAATRTELRYMNDRLALPYETWNYSHNRNYLCYLQEQLGMAAASIRGGQDLMSAPTDPENKEEAAAGFSDQGVIALARAHIKFQRWDEILKPGTIGWPADDYSQAFRAFAETIALTGKGESRAARERLAEFQAAVHKLAEKEKEAESWFSLHLKAAEGEVLLAEGNSLDGQRLLLEAAATEQTLRDKHQYSNDPPDMPWPIMRLVGDLHLRRGDARLAIEAYERALKNEANDGFTLAGLARAWNLAGDKDKAREYAGRLEYEWSGADPGLRWLAEVRALGLNATPIARTPGAERPYRPEELASYGPSNWAPFAAPKLECLDVNGKPVRLENYRGKNVLLVFYLNEGCVHCVEQLEKINERAADLLKEDTVVLAVSSTPPAKNKESMKLGKLGLQLLSDRNHENARRYASYDDFEELELHSTILIDAQGRVRWKRTGGDPFTNIDFLMRELKRINGPH